jgi:hypothetical protein
MKFALDTPAGGDIDRVTRFSGWCLTDVGQPVEQIVLPVENVVATLLERTPRCDLADHADPGHYFNMTEDGLKRVFAGFEIEEHGVLVHLYPSQSLRRQLEQALPYIAEGKWKHMLSNLMRELQADGAALDTALGPIGRRNLAAGVYLLGRKQ